MKRLIFFFGVLAIIFSLNLTVMAQWVQTSLPFSYGGIVTSFAVSDTNLFAGITNSIGGGSGVFRSTDNGTNWAVINTGLTNTYVYALAVNGKNLFAGTNGGGIFRSIDNGNNWTAINTGLTDTTFHTLTVIGTTNDQF